MAEWALVLTVGTTADPLKKAVEEAKAEAEKKNASLAVWLLYGRPLPNQHPDPFEVAAEVRQYAENLGLRVRPCEISEPEELDVCLDEMRSLLQELSGDDKVIVNYTGGTKAMSAAIVHAALTTQFAGELGLHYVGGQIRDKNGRVIREAMEIRRTAQTVTQERMRRVLELMQEHRYELAAYEAQGLPHQGRYGFLRTAAEAIHLWDSFAYEQASEKLRRLKPQANGFIDDQQLGSLAEIVRRLVAEVITPVLNTLRAFRKWEETDNRERVEPEGIQLLCADILENAYRCLKRREWTEAVLRSYRALEAAVQGSLAMLNISPWQFDVHALSPQHQQAVLSQLKYEPKELVLSSGMVVWQVVTGRVLSSEQQKWLKDLQRTRNRSMLEHGYRACDQDDAERVWEYSNSLSSWILGSDLNSSRIKVSLNFTAHPHLS